MRTVEETKNSFSAGKKVVHKMNSMHRRAAKVMMSETPVMIILCFLLVTAISCSATPPDQSSFKEPMLKAAFKGDIEAIQQLLDKGANVNLVLRKDGATALMIVSANGYIEAVRLLLKRGASVNQGDTFNYTALVCAVRSNQYSIAQLLLEHGADIHVRELKSHYVGSVLFGNAAMVRLLLKNGIDPDVEINERSGTVLIEASRLGHTEVVKALLEHGANPHAKSSSGITSLMRAKEKNYDEIVRLLKDAGAIE